MSPRKTAIWRAALAVMVAAGLGLFWTRRQGMERRALFTLSPAERQEIYQREVATFRTLCIIKAGEADWEERCQQRADFLLRFPECDSQCQVMMRGALPAAAR